MSTSTESTPVEQTTKKQLTTKIGAGGWTVVVGASSAIGRSISRIFADHGNDLILAGRDIEDLQRTAADVRVRSGRRVEVIAFDAMEFEKHEDFWHECQSRAAGGVDGLVVLHGSLPVQAEAQSDFKTARAAIDLNFTSVVSLLTHAANDFQAKTRGSICVFSSVAGDRGRQSNYVYGSAKAGLTAFLQGLRNRLHHSGVKVITVKPGFVDTAMTWGLVTSKLNAQPEVVAKDVFNAVRHGKPVLYTPWFWRYIMMIVKHIPECCFMRMKM